MKLYTITAASIIALVVSIAGDEIVQVDRVGHAYWCGEIASEKRVQREIFHDTENHPRREECEPSQRFAEAYATKGDGTLVRTVAQFIEQREMAWVERPKSLASMP